MTAAETEVYKAQLQSLLQRHNDGMTRLQDEALHGVGGESGGSLSNAPTHLADLGTAYHAEEVGLILMQTEERLLGECNAALDRIDAGTYGLCGRCGRDIPAGRLDAFPYARYCIRCSEKLEARGESAVRFG
jgi:RNA polymerase-binding transcription factor DksA